VNPSNPSFSPEADPGYASEDAPDQMDGDQIDGELLGEMAAAMPGTPPSPALWARIDAAAEPRVVFDWSRTINTSLADGEWRQIAPGVRRKTLWSEAAFLIACDAGATIPEHVHGRFEHCVMIQGELLVGGRKFRSGDYHGVPEGIAHPPLTSPDGCVFLIHKG